MKSMGAHENVHIGCQCWLFVLLARWLPASGLQRLLQSCQNLAWFGLGASHGQALIALLCTMRPQDCCSLDEGHEVRLKQCMYSSACHWALACVLAAEVTCSQGDVQMFVQQHALSLAHRQQMRPCSHSQPIHEAS